MEKWLETKPMMAAMSVILAAGIVTGCGTDNNLSAPPQNSPAQNESTDTDGENQQDGENAPAGQEGTETGHNFAKFELEVKYQDDQKYEADYEAKGKGEAEIEDDLSGRELKGDEAYAELAPILEQLNFDADSDDQEVIKQVLEVFGLADDFTEFELEVAYADGTSQKIETKK